MRKTRIDEELVQRIEDALDERKIQRRRMQQSPDGSERRGSERRQTPRTPEITPGNDRPRS